MHYPKIAIIGGMGKEAARLLDAKIDKCSKKTKHQDFIYTIIIQNSQIDDRNESILKNNNNPVYGIHNSIKIAEKANVDSYIIACNTAHYFIDEIKNLTKLTNINLIEETLVYISQNTNDKTVGLLSTIATFNMGINHKSIEKYNINIYGLSRKQKNIIHKTIYKIKEQNSILLQEIKEISEVIAEIYKNGIKTIILGCTELTIIENSVKKLFPDIIFIDPMEVVANIIVKKYIN